MTYRKYLLKNNSQFLACFFFCNLSRNLKNRITKNGKVIKEAIITIKNPNKLEVVESEISKNNWFIGV